jgi:hypothetical protein
MSLGEVVLLLKPQLLSYGKRKLFLLRNIL